MAISSSLKPQIDMPVWEWTRFAPAVSAAASSTCAAPNSNFHVQHGRYVYYLISATSFWRYDTWTDTYLQLSSPPIAIATWASLQFNGSGGFDGQVLAASTNTLTIPAYFGAVLKDFDVVITSGTGAGQRRTITAVADPVAADNGIVTAVNNVIGTLTITDTAKAWAINQWVGYNVRFTFGTGLSQVRRVISNSATVLVLGDSTRYVENINCNPMITSPAINATAGTQAVYQIESSVATVNANWAVTPDATSNFRVQSGSIMLASSAAATPFYTLQHYDIASDTWYVRTANSLNWAGVGADGTISFTQEEASIWDRGLATSGSTTGLVDSTKNWSTNQWVGYWVRITSGTGEGQIRQISASNATSVTWVTSGTAPDITSKYVIAGFDAGTATSGGTSSLTDSTKNWSVNRWANYMIRITYGTGAGQALAILSNTSTAITTVEPWATTPDATSVYEIHGDNDKLYMMISANAAALIHNINDDIATFGRRVESGVSRNASFQFGALKPAAIASVSNVTTTATITTANTHSIKAGQSVTIKGCTDANFNGTFTVASVPSTTTFTYSMGGTPAATTLANAQSTTTLSDSTKNWTVNQWAGYLCYMTTSAVTASTGAATGQCAQIASNTATTLTFVTTVTAPTNGITRFVITPRSAVGSSENGIATGTHSTTTLQDTTKTWVVNIFAGRKVKMLTGTGQSQELTISSNTSNTLTFATGTAPTNNVSVYSILEQPVRGGSTALKWGFNPSISANKGKFAFIARGGAALGFDRLNLNTDRFEMMPITPQIETLTTGTMYAYDGADRLFFTKDATQRVYALNISTNILEGGSMFPYAAPTAVIGNRMEIFTTADGLKYLWLNRASNVECFRLLVWW